MTYTVICSCTDGLCPVNCNVHCGGIFNAKKINQALTLKHVHTAAHENHDVEVRNNGVPLNPDVEGRC